MESGSEIRPCRASARSRRRSSSGTAAHKRAAVSSAANHILLIVVLLPKSAQLCRRYKLLADVQFFFDQLFLIQIVINSAGGEQFRVRSLFTDSATFEHENPIRILDRGNAMRDQDAGSILPEFPQILKNPVLC